MLSAIMAQHGTARQASYCAYTGPPCMAFSTLVNRDDIISLDMQKMTSATFFVNIQETQLTFLLPLAVTATDMPQGCDKTKGTPTPTPTPTTPTPVLATPTPTRKLISGMQDSHRSVMHGLINGIYSYLVLSTHGVPVQRKVVTNLYPSG